MIIIPTDKNLSFRELQGSDLSRLDLSRANFEGANLTGARLKQASLTRANLRQAILVGVNLTDATLQSADIQQADLRKANLTGVYATWADFRDSNLDQANLEGAILDAARLEECSLEGANLKNITYSRSTTWPAGFKPHKVIMTYQPENVITMSDLLDFLDQVSRSQAIDYENSLEQYLPALWGVIQTHKSEPMSANLMARMFSEAFTSKPVNFDGHWRDYVSSSNPDEMISDFEYLKWAILSQIIDLHDSSEMDLKENWNNLSIEGYFEAGTRGFDSHSEKKSLNNASITSTIGSDLSSSQCTWRDMADILHLGQIYE